MGICKKSCRLYPEITHNEGLEKRKYSIDPYALYMDVIFCA